MHALLRSPALRSAQTWMSIGCGLLGFVLPFVVLRRMFVGEELWFITGDSPKLYYPDLVMQFQALVGGEFPLWDPWERLGDPFFTDPQSGIFYPGNYLFMALAAVVGEFSYTLYEIKSVAHISFGGLGLFVYARRCLHVPRSAAVFGAIVFSFGPFFVSHLAHCLIWPYAFTPWLLYLLHSLATTTTARHRPRWAAAIALTVGLVLTAQSPPGAYYTLVTASLFGAFALVALVPTTSTSRWRPRAKFLGWGGLALGLGFLLGLPVLIPAMNHMEHSVLAERTFSYFKGGSTTLDGLLTILEPGRQNEERWLYIGVLPLVFASIGVFSRTLKAPAFFWIVTGTFFLTLTTHELPTLRWWFDLAPGASLFRIPPRYIAVTQVAVSVAAAIGAATLVDRIPALVARFIPDRRRLRTSVLVLVVAIVSLASAGVVYDQSSHFGLYRLQRLRAPLFERDVLAKDVAEAKLDYRFINDGYLYIGSGDRFRLRDGRGYNTNFVTGRFRAYLRALRPGHKVNLLRLVGAKYYGQQPQNRLAAVLNLQTVDTYQRIKPRLFRHIDEVMPAAFFVDAVRLVPNPTKARHDVIVRSDYRDYVTLEGPKNAPPLDISGLRRHPGAHPLPLHSGHKNKPKKVKRNAASAKPKPAPRNDAKNVDAKKPDAKKPDAKKPDAKPKPVGDGTVASTAFRSGRLVALTHQQAVVEVTAPAEGLVVYNALYYPGWVAYVDGVRQPVAAANYLQMATRVGPGTHRVIFAFETTWLRAPLTAASLALALIFSLLFVPALVRRWPRRQTDASESSSPTPVALEIEDETLVERELEDAAPVDQTLEEPDRQD